MSIDTFAMQAAALQSGDAWWPVDADLQRDIVPNTRALLDVLATAAHATGLSRAALAIGESPALRVIATHGEGDIPATLCALPDGVDVQLHARDCVQPDSALLHACALRTCIRVRVRDRQGDAIGALLLGDPQLRNADTLDVEVVQRIARTASDVIERHRLLRRTRITDQIVQAGFSALVVVDARGQIAFVNRSAERLFGSGARGMRGMPLSVLFPPHLQADPATAEAWLRAQTPHVASFHLSAKSPDGRTRTLEAARCGWAVGEGRGVALVLRDITDQLEQQDRLRHMAHFDTLTGLPNRNALVDTLDTLLATDTCPLGVALLDLDNFKSINDTLGHPVGDRVLVATAQRLQAAMPEGASVARFAGDEFAMVYPGLRADALAQHLEQVIGAVAQPHEVDGHVIHVEASIGLAMHDASPSEQPITGSSDLIARADLAMYKAKAAGGRRVARFYPTLRRDAIERRRLDLELRRAHANGEFELHYQPQIDLANGYTFGAEALLRWRHPERGLLGPVAFLDALSASPLVADVGHWIVQQACEDAARWAPVDGRDVAISINLFPQQVNDGRLQSQVDAALSRSGLRADRLELEITESIALRPDDTAARALSQLRERGVRLAFDDFGTGYASLSMLQRFPIDRVKIDRSFVRDMEGNRNDAAIVRSIVLISRNLELDVIAEGVETHSQADLLRGLGCTAAQGFLYAPALAPVQFDHWLAAQSRSPASPPWQQADAAHG